jgi:hypothetical protein
MTKETAKLKKKTKEGGEKETCINRLCSWKPKAERKMGL